MAQETPEKKIIKVGDQIPGGKFIFQGFPPEMVDFKEYVAGKAVLIVTFPGAFTPVWSNQHLPGMVQAADKLFAHGIDEIIGLTCNDQFMVEEWGKIYDPEKKMTLMADANGELAKAMGLDIDLTAALGLGVRYARATLEVDNGKVTKMDLEDMDGVLVPCKTLAEHIVPGILAKPKKRSRMSRQKSSQRSQQKAAQQKA